MLAWRGDTPLGPLIRSRHSVATYTEKSNVVAYALATGERTLRKAITSLTFRECSRINDVLVNSPKNVAIGSLMSFVESLSIALVRSMTRGDASVDSWPPARVKATIEER
jgi:hypothetical protein